MKVIFKCKPMNEDVRYQRWAHWVGFLSEVQQKTFRDVAVEAGVHRSNISSFVHSEGKVKNLSEDNLIRVLFVLGVLKDGLLRPGDYQWVISPTRASYVDNVILTLLDVNRPAKSYFYALLNQSYFICHLECSQCGITFITESDDFINVLKEKLKEINSEVIELEPQKGLDIVLRFKMMERSELLKNDIVSRFYYSQTSNQQVL